MYSYRECGPFSQRNVQRIHLHIHCAYTDRHESDKILDNNIWKSLSDAVHWFAYQCDEVIQQCAGQTTEHIFLARYIFSLFAMHKYN